MLDIHNSSVDLLIPSITATIGSVAMIKYCYLPECDMSLPSRSTNSYRLR